MFLLEKCEHTTGDRRCVECWVGFPKKCRCGGFIHCQFVKESWQGEKILAYGCDSCGDQYRFAAAKKRKK